MGLGGISPGSLLLLAFIYVLLFGSGRLKTVGQDLGEALRSFRKGLEGDASDKTKDS